MIPRASIRSTVNMPQESIPHRHSFYNCIIKHPTVIVIDRRVFLMSVSVNLINAGEVLLESLSALPKKNMCRRIKLHIQEQ